MVIKESEAQKMGLTLDELEEKLSLLADKALDQGVSLVEWIGGQFEGETSLRG